MDFTIGFIGLGAIGYPMAASIRRKFPSASTVIVFDINRPTSERFREEFQGISPVKIGDSPRQIASKADVVISMVPGAKEVSHVYLDSEIGIIGAKPNNQRLLLECSTIDVETARDVARQIHESGQGLYVDAPVSGGVPAAEKGTLSFMIGHIEPTGSDATGERLKQIVTMMGDPNKLFWCGAVGSGLAAKISNNYISCSVLLLIAEAMAIGVKSGVDPKMLQRIIHNSTGQTFMGDNMFLKDLSLGIEAARRANLEPTMADAAYGVFEKAAKDPRCIDRDGSSVYLYVSNPRNSKTDLNEEI